MDQSNSQAPASPSPDEAIIAAQKAESRNTIKLFIIALVLLVAAALIYLVVQNIGSENSGSSGETEPVAVQVTPEELSQAREAFKSALAEFEAEIQPMLDNDELLNWDKKAVAETLMVKETAIADFAQGGYSTALQQLTEASGQGQALKQAWDQAFEAGLSEAMAAFDREEISQAQLALNQAMKIKPSEPRGHVLQAQLDAFPQVARLFKQFDIAVTENNLGKQISILEDILRLDGTRTDVQEALDRAKQQRQEQLFQGHIETGLAQVAAGDFTVANDAYSRAQAIFPGRPELKLLEKKLGREKSRYTLAAVHTRLEKFQKQDDWASIARLVADAEPHFPVDAQLLQLKEDAGNILALRKEAADYIARPQRLADSNVQSYAEQWIRKAVPYLSKSEGVARDVEVISQHIKTFTTKFPLTIFSDNKTHITVLRHGVVGKTKEKTIHLPAGEYTLEASRKGYRSKVLKVTVNNQQNNQVTLVCDERI
ncbi:hypothetical protein SG34_002615 [Thalassomonas viridans]|uniref:PEGA domain-containing protein n=1 Tax=Thalassomonas viridans TaxID=137584 RepID=A0AAE9Z301_9GAMM|nr:hypothetical protein [Thalassomonas viridans]WDE05846.1 hypothetical protein SG34_002615 [Thalassomonas viridans]